MKVKKTITSTIELELDISGATLLTTEEARKLPERLRTYGKWWWLRSPGNNVFTVAVVRYDGCVCFYGNFVDSISVAVRPALIISNLESSNLQVGDTFEFGGKEFEIISNDKAFCLTDIGMSAFRDYFRALDANDYEKSDVKKYIDYWFEEVKETKE